MYTIIYERDGCEHRIPVVFAEKQPAMDNACELLRLGFQVLRVQGQASALEPAHSMTIGVQYQPASTARHCYASEGMQTGTGHDKIERVRQRLDPEPT
jgi:hypothetical protein